ncbi:hypothetical protein B0T16DRAFT_460643 [Cercophora newfieldiana]|uniref:Uncharacterized protein n=1 Tax=Cercophora newfieldiana TaxID=92897 RepID=A0AA39Y3V5_9PEZI|nr:hypothetical protein B0T16DRAFT_460643 [Cercophora newfieldiana]
MGCGLAASILTALRLAGMANGSPLPETVTVSGPGVSDHGKPNLVCFPTKAMNVAVFFFVNYLAHAASTRIPPGSSTYHTIYTMFNSLHNPMVGITVATGAISRWSLGLKSAFPYIAFPPDNLETAHRAGALVTASRTQDWTPHPSDKVLRGVKVVERDRKEGSPPTETEKQDAPAQSKFDYYHIRMAGVQDLSESRDAWQAPGSVVDLGGSNVPGALVFGGFKLPRGYRWVSLPMDVVVEPLSSRSTRSEPRAEQGQTQPNPGGGSGHTDFGAVYSIAQPIAAVVQVVSAGITLYRARGDQLDRYGFTAFGLTVVPYLVMSVINFFAHIAVPKYNTLLLVQSDILEEVAVRCGYEHSTSLGGVVAKLLPGDHLSPGQVDVSLVEDNPPRPSRYRTLNLLQNNWAQAAGKENEWEICDAAVDLGRDTADGAALVVLVDQLPVNPEASSEDTNNKGRDCACRGDIVVPKFPSVQKRVGGSSPMSRLRLWGAPQRALLANVVSLLMGLLVVAVIGIVSRFQLGIASKPGWRVLMIVWLVATNGSPIYIDVIVVMVGFSSFIFVEPERVLRNISGWILQHLASCLLSGSWLVNS